MAQLQLHGATVALGRRDVVRDVSAETFVGELVVIGERMMRAAP